MCRPPACPLSVAVHSQSARARAFPPSLWCPVGAGRTSPCVEGWLSTDRSEGAALLHRKHQPRSQWAPSLVHTADSCQQCPNSCLKDAHLILPFLYRLYLGAIEQLMKKRFLYKRLSANKYRRNDRIRMPLCNSTEIMDTGNNSQMAAKTNTFGWWVANFIMGKTACLHRN